MYVILILCKNCKITTVLQESV